MKGHNFKTLKTQKNIYQSFQKNGVAPLLILQDRLTKADSTTKLNIYKQLTWYIRNSAREDLTFLRDIQSSTNDIWSMFDRDIV
jgi:hypothetical protein